MATLRHSPSINRLISIESIIPRKANIIKPLPYSISLVKIGRFHLSIPSRVSSYQGSLRICRRSLLIRISRPWVSVPFLEIFYLSRSSQRTRRGIFLSLYNVGSEVSKGFGSNGSIGSVGSICFIGSIGLFAQSAV
jgi:hypothetical protein